jgi:GDP-4-dehydro-6-deoxy-D-mannose reductase
MKKYLITGCSGFAAQHFLDYLDGLQEECIVLGIDKNSLSLEQGEYRYVRTTFQQLDLLDKKRVDDILETFRPDFILHLASHSSVAYSWEHPSSSFINNLTAFLNLIERARILRLPCRVLSVGSSEEYGNVTEDLLPLREELPLKPISPYAVARVSQGMLSQVYAHHYNVDVILTRSFNHIGPRQKERFVISSFAKKLVDIKNNIDSLKEIRVGNIEVVRDFVDVRDMVKAYYLLLHKGRKGEVYNICSGKGYSLKDLLLRMMRILGLDVRIIVDEGLIRPEEIQIAIGSYEKIHRDVGWEPSIAIEDSLRDIIGYWLRRSS